jgi:putative transposase
MPPREAPGQGQLTDVPMDRLVQPGGIDSQVEFHRSAPRTFTPGLPLNPTLRGPKPLPVELTDEQRDALEALLRRHATAQQIALRAGIILAAAQGQSNAQIARSFRVSPDTVRLWRSRWVASQPIPLGELDLEERLADAPRAGRTPRITAEQVCRIVALACEAPDRSGRPITHWTGREIADEVIQRGIVARISPRHAARLLKKPGPQAAPGPLLAHPGARGGVRGQGRRDQPALRRGGGDGRAARAGRQHR